MGYREKYTRSSNRDRQRGPDTAGKTENFFSRNVRLITFLVCIGVFLAFFVPIVAYETIDYLKAARDTRPEMTLNDVLRLSEQNGKISEKQIQKFKTTHVDVQAATIYYYFDISPHYHVLAIADKNTKMLIYCQLDNFETGETADMLVDDIYAFLNKEE